MFIKKKKFKNKDGSERVYAQVCKSKRVDGKPKTFVLYDLGRIDTPEGQKLFRDFSRCILNASEELEFFDAKNHLRCDDTKEFGTHYVFKRLWKKLGFSEVISKHLSKNNTDFDIAESVYNMVLNRLSFPTSKHALEDWQQGIYGIKQFKPQHYYRAMDYLMEAKDEIELGCYEKIKDLFNLSVDVVLFDTTTLVYYGEGDKHEDLLARGFSKAKRSDLKQIVVGVIMSKEGVPLGHEVFSGNTNDVSCFKQIIDKVSLKFNLGKLILVGDRGMISKKNIKHLDDKGYEYILGYRMRTISKSERAKILEKSKLKVINKDKLHWREVSYDGSKLLVCYNPERAKLDQKKREEIIERIKEKIKYAGDVKVLIGNPDYKKFLKITGKKPELDESRVESDALYDGVYVLTSNTKMNGHEIIDAYKSLWQIEAGFRALKSELELGPIYHWKDRRIRAHVMICFLALVLRTNLNKKLKEKYKDASYRKVLNDLRSLKAVNLEIKSVPITVRTDCKEGAMQAIKALAMRSPPLTLSHSPISNLVV